MIELPIGKWLPGELVDNICRSMSIRDDEIENLPSSISNRFSNREGFKEFRWAAITCNTEAGTSISFAAASSPYTLISSEHFDLFWSPQPATTAPKSIRKSHICVALIIVRKLTTS